jgi:hypothetical protein
LKTWKSAGSREDKDLFNTVPLATGPLARSKLTWLWSLKGNYLARQVGKQKHTARAHHFSTLEVTNPNVPNDKWSLLKWLQTGFMAGEECHQIRFVPLVAFEVQDMYGMVLLIPPSMINEGPDMRQQGGPSWSKKLQCYQHSAIFSSYLVPK